MDGGFGGTDGFLLTFSRSRGANLPSQSPPGFLYIGGSGDDRINAIGGINPIFFVGETKSSDVTNLGRPLTTFLNGSSDALIGSVSSFLNSISLRYFGGSGDDSATSVAIDHQGRLVIAGKTTSPDFPLQNPLFNKLSGPSDGFVTSFKLFGAETNTLNFSTYIGGSGDDEIRSMVSSFQGFPASLQTTLLYLAGTTNSLDLPIANAAQPAYGGGETDAFVMQLDLDARKILYSTYIGGSGRDEASVLAVNAALGYGQYEPVVLGSTTSTDLPVKNAFQPELSGPSDAFLVQFDITGGLQSLTYFGGSGNEVGQALAVSDDNTALLGGASNSPDLPVPYQNDFPSIGSGGMDGFAASLALSRFFVLPQQNSRPKEFWTGRNFIASITVFISADIPGSALLSLSSSDASRLLVGLNGSGTSQISVPVSYKGQVNNSKIAFDLIGLADNGETTVTISLDGYADQILRIRFGPVVVRPFGALPDGLPGQVNVSDVVPISPAFGVIDDTGQFNQGLYGYPFPGSPLERIDFSLSDPSLADLPWSSRVFPGQNGDCHLRTIDNGQLTIKAKSSLLPVFGPDTLTFLINRHKIVIRSFTAGKNLSAKVASIYDRFPPDTNAVSLLTSKDPNRLCLVIGENCVTSGFSNLVRALDDSGSVTVTYSTEYRSGETDIQIKPGKIFVQELPSVPT